MINITKTGLFRRLLLTALLVLAPALIFFLSPVRAKAAPTDEIKDFTITVDVNEDASLQMTYHLEWTVLDDSIGALDWISLGVPNNYHENITSHSNTIDHIIDNGSSLAIYLDRSYGEGETVSIDFSMTQDHMYQIDQWVEGETVYTFTPAWFDGMEVKHEAIRWNANKAGAWQPNCLQENGFLVFETSLSEGEKFTISVVYPNDAFGFAIDRQKEQTDTEYGGSGQEGDEKMTISDWIFGLMGLAMLLGFIATPIIMVFRFLKWISAGASFGSPQQMEKKITRTKIEYYETCPGCGAPREEGKDSCSYCGHSMIKSKEVVEEDQIEHPENYTRTGTYPYGNIPNTFIMVNAINVPVRGPRSSRPSGPRGGSSHHSSCASSCACASHCACASSCACACACASSGRAGCSVKDFFKKSIHEKRVRVESKSSCVS